jgi:hypothetical protein
MGRSNCDGRIERGQRVGREAARELAAARQIAILMMTGMKAVPRSVQAVVQLLGWPRLPIYPRRAATDRCQPVSGSYQVRWEAGRDRDSG